MNKFKNKSKHSIFKSVCAFILAFMLIVTNMTGLVELKAAGVSAPTVDKVFYGATTISGGNVVERGTVYVTLKDKDGIIKDKVSVTPTSGSTWNVNLSENVEVAEGDTVEVYQRYSKFTSSKVTVNAEPSLAYNHKNDLKMPSGDFYLEQYVANIVNDEEKAEALRILKEANPSFADDIASIDFVVRGEDENKTAYYTITYTDKSKTGEIAAPDLNIIGVIENKYKVSYKAGEGSGTMADEEVEAGKEYTILKSTFTVPTDKEFDYWQVGFEKKKAGEKIIVNNDIEITAVYKYVINPTIDKIITKVDHPINYDMYKKAIKDFPSALTVEHIEVKTAPDISTIGTTEAEIEVRFSDGQFRTLNVTIGVVEDPKDATIKDLNDKIAKLNTEIDKLNNTITEKDGKITELNGKITELENQLKDCQDKCEKDKQALRNQIAELEKVKSNLEIQVKENRELIVQLRSQITDLKQQVEDWKKIAGDKDTKIKELENNIKELNTKLEIANNANIELKEKLATANQKITDLEAEIKRLEVENTELKDKIKELEGKLDKKDAEIKSLANKVNELETQIAEQKTKSEADAKEIEKLTKELEDLKAQLANKNTEVENLNGKISTLKETVKTLEGEKTELTNNVTILETKVKELKDKLETANNRIIELEKENAALKADNKNLTEKVTELTEKVKKAEDENATLKAKIDELNAQIAELSKSQCDLEEVNRLKQEKAALEAKLEGKDELIQELRNQIAELKKSLTNKDAEYKEKIKELEEKINTLTTENAGLKEQLTNANEIIKSIEALLKVEKEKNKENTNNIKELEEAKKSLEEEKITLEGKVAELEENIKTTEAEKEELVKNKTDLEAEVEKLKAELESKDKDEADKTKLQEKISELEALIEKEKTDIAEKDKLIEDLKKNANETCKVSEETKKKIEELNNKIKLLEAELKSKNDELAKEKDKWNDNYYFWKDYYSPNYNYDKDLRDSNYNLKKENDILKEKVKTLENKKSETVYINNKEDYVTIFDLNSTLYKTYLGTEFLTQAEMTDFKGFIKPFISNSRTMLPLRYMALSLGLDVKWDNTTKTATFINYGEKNVLKPGVVTINANTLVMKDDAGNVIPVDSKPILKEGRFYVSIANITRAFGGTNGDIYDGIDNTVEWDASLRRVLVYKYIK